ncbi:MAG: flagellar brake protein [Lachnospiraceae bacterium]|nr:flagellar brake protein [Lachnospiraceae bacterium]
MIEKLISPGDKLEMRSTVSVVLPDGTEGVKTYKSSVYDILEDGRLEIAMPVEQQRLVLLPVDGEYDVCFVSKGGMYQATVRIIDRQRINNTYIVVAEMLTNLHKFQRREYYRFNCVIDMAVKELDAQETELLRKGIIEEPDAANMARGVIVDISGGGLRFVSRQLYRQGSILMLLFTLPVSGEEKEFLTAAKVIYSGEIENREAEYENRVKFEFISNTRREEIIRYIFDAERKNRKYGKGC